MKLETLLKTDYCFRWVKSDREGNVMEISVEKQNLTKDFWKFLNKKGYKAKLGREDFNTEHFVKVG